MNIYTINLPVCNSGQYTYVTGLCNFLFVLIDRINSYIQRIAFKSNLLLNGFKHSSYITSFFQCKQVAFAGMGLHKLERRNYDRKSLVSIKYRNLHSFREELILLCQGIR